MPSYNNLGDMAACLVLLLDVQCLSPKARVVNGEGLRMKKRIWELDPAQAGYFS